MTFLKDCQEPPVTDHGAHTSCLPRVWGARPEPSPDSAVADLHQHLSIPPFLLLPSTAPAEPREPGFLSDATCTSKSIPVPCFKQMNPSPAFFPSLPITRTASAVNASIPPHSSFFQFIFCLPLRLENGFLSISLSQKVLALWCQQRLFK